MYIFHIITRGDLNGGAQAHIFDMSKEQIAQGHQVSIICGKSSKVFDQLKSVGIKVFCMQSIRRSIQPYQDFISTIKLIKLIRKENPDIIACHTSKSGVIGRFAATVTRKKSVYTPHSWVFSEPSHAKESGMYIKIEKFMSYFGNKVITVSENDFNIANRLKISKKSKFITIHNGMADVEPRLIKDNYKIKNNIVKLVVVARLEEPKDFNILFNALAQTKSKAWTLDIFGDGSLRYSLEQQCQYLGISDSVTFHGDCKNISQRLLESDIFLLTSKSEGFPISIIEAMRAGLPIIASNVGGVPEVIKPNENGILIDNKKLNTLINAIDFFLSDYEKIETYGRDGRSKYEKLLTVKTMTNKTLQLYKNILAGEQ